MDLRKKIFAYVGDKYHTTADYPWMDKPDFAVLRHGDDRKWYGLIMYLPRHTLGLTDHVSPLPLLREDGTEDLTGIDVLNIRCEPDLMELLRSAPGILPAYHMNRKNWITVLLDGTVSEEQIYQLLDLSFELTASREELKAFRLLPPKDWIIPSNPNYYDVVAAFEEKDTILWKQGAGIQPGDTVFLYVGAPYSSILYYCTVVETDIPFHSERSYPRISKAMYIHLEQKFAPGLWSFARLGEYGVHAVRGPRSMPPALKEDMLR